MRFDDWPFDDDDAFWTWAMDVDAELCEQDEDVLLHDVHGMRLLVAAADRPDCPKGGYCCGVLEDFTARTVFSDDPAGHALLRAAMATAASDITRRWVAYAERLLGYREPAGQVNRALAEQMAADLLSTPSLQRRMAAIGRADWLTVDIAARSRLWLCTRPASPAPRHLYINRRTGAWRVSHHGPVPESDLRTL